MRRDVIEVAAGMARHPSIAAALTFLVVAGCGESAELPPTSTHVPACEFHSGALPAETLARGAPHGASIPIDHIVVLVQENHSFDNYFGRLPAFGHAGVDGLPADASNPDISSVSVPVFHQDRYCTADTDHSWTGSHLEFNNGQLRRRRHGYLPRRAR